MISRWTSLSPPAFVFSPAVSIAVVVIIWAAIAVSGAPRRNLRVIARNQTGQTSSNQTACAVDARFDLVDLGRFEPVAVNDSGWVALRDSEATYLYREGKWERVRGGSYYDGTFHRIMTDHVGVSSINERGELAGWIARASDYVWGSGNTRIAAGWPDGRSRGSARTRRTPPRAATSAS